MKLMKKIFLLSVIAISLTVFTKIALAGGCCFEKVTVLNKGVANGEAVKIEGKLLNYSYLMNKEGEKYKANQPIEVIIKTEGIITCATGLTDNDGYFSLECQSNAATAQNVQVRPKQTDPQVGQATPVVIEFSADPNPSASPIPSPTLSTNTSPSPTATDTAVMEERLLELEAKVDQQQEEIGTLQKIVNRIMEFFKNIF